MAQSLKQSTRLDLPLLLPEVDDLQDDCVDRVIKLLEQKDGVAQVHVVRSGADCDTDSDGASSSSRTASPLPSRDLAQLCLHYDPERVTLEQLQGAARSAGADVTDRFAHVVIPFRAVTTEDAGGRMESALRALPGVTAASVNLAGQIARVEYDKRRVDRGAIERRLADEGAAPTTRRSTPAAPAAAPAKGKQDHDHDAPGHVHEDAEGNWYVRNRELAWSIISGVLLTAGWLLERAGNPVPYLVGALFVGAYFFGARDNVAHFFKDLRRGRFNFNIDLLMVVAAIGAALLGAYAEGALLLFLFSFGHALEHYALGRARNAIRALAELVPTRATVLRGEGSSRREENVAIEQVMPGDMVVIKPAERFPVDGTVREGKSSVNQAPITGESMPVGKAAGAEVFAGSVNGEGALVVEVTKAVGDRTLDRVIKLVAEAETQKAPTQQFTDRFEKIFVPLVLIADALLIVVPPLLGIWTWGESFYRAMALLVAASPCALALGTPAAVLSGIAQAARKGVLIKGGANLENMGKISVLAVDKTGTITKGEPAVTDIVPWEGVSDAELLSVTAAVERRSQHPLARAVMKAAESRSLTLPQAGDLESVTGMGIRSAVDGRTVEVGRLLMFDNAAAGQADGAVPAGIRDTVQRLEAAGRSTMVVRRAPLAGDSGGWLGVIAIADEPRANVRQTLDRLREAGMKRIIMLTGDNKGVGEAIGKEVGVDEVRANLLPEDKLTAIKELAAHGPVAMVGDGVNDAPALAHATIGIAMGGAGTAAALETADIALMGDDLERLPFAVALSRKASAIIKQNLFVSLGVIAILVVATVGGFAGIGVAVVVHEGSTLVVIANALRLLTFRDRYERKPVAA